MRSSHLWCLLLIMTLFAADGASGGRTCSKKWLDHHRMVCVCNATFCDTIEPVPQLDVRQYVQYVSDPAGLRFHQSIRHFNNTPGRKGVHLALNEKKTYQSIFGFGAAFTDAAGINIRALSERTQKNLLMSYFSPQGIELNFGRVPIAGSDFSTHTYSYDSVEGDATLKHFNLTMEDFEYKIPLIKRAMAFSGRHIRLVGAAWSPPPWMKTNNQYSGFSFLKPEFFRPWANYHVKFLDAYKREGLTFWAISTGNEPLNGIIPINAFNSLGWMPGTQLTWVRDHLGPVLKASEHKDTRLLANDDQRFMLPIWVYNMRSDHEAAKYIDGFAVHWYYDTLIPTFLQDLTHNQFPNKFILYTEACYGDKPWQFQKVDLGSWDRGETYMTDIIQNLQHWSTGWIDWNLALNQTGGPNWAKNYVDASVIVNAESDEFYKQPMFYALGHFSKFVPEGSVRVDLSPGDSHGVHSVAFKTPQGETVIVVFNKNDYDYELTITDPDRGHINELMTRKSFHTIIYR